MSKPNGAFFGRASREARQGSVCVTMRGIRRKIGIAAKAMAAMLEHGWTAP
jgi:hypothetical protein